MQDLEYLILALALENAIKFNGRASSGAVIGKLISIKPEIKNEIKKISPIIEAKIKQVNKLTLKAQQEKFDSLKTLIEKKPQEKKHEILPELKNSKKGKIVTRFAPYPSGPLHIGNAKQLIINDYYVRKYSGKLYLVFDDTIGSDEKNIDIEAYNLILEGAKYLGIKFDKIYYKSDRLKNYYKYAKELVKKDKAYVCFCDATTLRVNREKSIECIHRNQSIKQNLDYLKQMLSNKFKEGEATLRIKTDIKHKNPAFRDRVLLRISNREHPRVGHKYKVWPLLDFSWAIDDYLLGITHIIRGKELMMESEMERYIWNILSWPQKEIIHTGLSQIKGVKISKSKSSQEVKQGVYSGWDDPRTWSLQALKKRGIRPEAIKTFCLAQGLSQGETTVPIENLYSENRKLLERDANRYFFVENPVRVQIKGAPTKKVELHLHPDFPKKGTRKFTTDQNFYISKKDFESLKDNKIYRLMECLNFKKVKKEYVFISEDYKDFKQKGEKIMHYLPVSDFLVRVDVVLEDAGVISGLAEPGVQNLKVGEIVQFERFGFTKLNSKEKQKLIFYFTHK